MPRDRRRWTSDEDALLRQAVSEALDESKTVQWREVAKSVPGRTNKDCRKRWCNVLADGMNKGPWSESEDERLFAAVKEHDCKWTRIAEAVKTRNSDQCSSHWTQTLNPEIDVSEWTAEEDNLLLKAVEKYGRNWTKICSKYLPNRPPLALKNRHSALQPRGGRNSTSSEDESMSMREGSTSLDSDITSAADHSDRLRQTSKDDRDRRQDLYFNNSVVGLPNTALENQPFDTDLNQQAYPMASVTAQSQSPMHTLPQKEENLCHWNNGAQIAPFSFTSYPLEPFSYDYSTGSEEQNSFGTYSMSGPSNDQISNPTSFQPYEPFVSHAASVIENAAANTLRRVNNSHHAPDAGERHMTMVDQDVPLKVAAQNSRQDFVGDGSNFYSGTSYPDAVLTDVANEGRQHMHGQLDEYMRSQRLLLANMRS